MNDRDRVRVLVVDDDAIVCAAVRRALKEQFLVDATTSGTEALTLIRREGYALVLCDLTMPGLSGSELIDVLEREAPALLRRLVMLTGRACTEDEQDKFDALGVSVLYKPFDRAELLATVTGCLTRAKGSADGA